MPETVEVTFRPCDAGSPPASDLIEGMIEELTQYYGRIDGPGTPSASPADFVAPQGVFLVGWAGEMPVACGGVKCLDPETGEIKRMYVVPEWRGRGVAGALLGALEDAAAALGCRAVCLDTGPAQPVARGLYERRGYEEVPDYNGNPHANYWGRKRLPQCG